MKPAYGSVNLATAAITQVNNTQRRVIAVTFKARPINSVNILLGTDSSLITATNGYTLEPGQEKTLDKSFFGEGTLDMSMFHFFATSSGQILDWFAVFET